MKIPPHFTALALVVTLPWISAAAPPEESEPEEPAIDIAPLLEPEDKVAVLPTEVSIDGADQPVLGRSLSDSLLGGLVAQGHAKVISYEELLKEEDPEVPKGAPPEALAGMLGRRLGVQRILVPRLVGTGEFFRFTVKEVDTGSYEVLRVFELSHSGDKDGIFGFVPMILDELAKDGSEPVIAEEKETKPSIKIWTWEEYQRDFGVEPDGGFSSPDADKPAPDEEPIVRKPPVPRSADSIVKDQPKHPAKEPEPVVVDFVELGKVATVNEKWGFCVIDMTGRKLKTTERLEIRHLNSDETFATMVVTRVSGDQAIADLSNGQDLSKISPGDVVFGQEVR